jgi:3-deoxy-D-manno-octulosonic-acid transferase
MIRTLSQQNVPVALINVRISPRSHRRYLKLGTLTQQTFARLSMAAVQGQEDIERLAALGVARDRIHVVGSLKFDAAIPQAGAAQFDPWELLGRMGVRRDDPILVGGSTWPGEEEVLFDLLHELRAELPRLFLVLVPRHAERTNEIVQVAKRKRVRMALRSELHPGEAECLLVNTTGELRTFYETATVVFVGKSLFVVEKSLQNPVEPAALGKPVLVGPNIESFEAIVRKFLAADAMVQVRDAAGLRAQARRLLSNAVAREQLGERAKQIVEQNRGAVERTVSLLKTLIGS